MPIVVEVLEEAEFDARYASELTRAIELEDLAKQAMSHEELMVKGEEVYASYCASCHMANGQGVPPAFPSLVGTPVVSGERDEHIRLVVDGVAGTAMQAFGAQLNPIELAAVVHYERHAWGNNAGDITQPLDVVNLGQ